MNTKFILAALCLFPLLYACTTDDALPQEENEEIDLDNPKPFSNNGQVLADINGESYDSDYNIGIAVVDQEETDYNSIIIQSYKIVGLDTTSIHLQMMYGLEDIQLNQNYVSLYPKVVTGVFLNSAFNQIGLGEATIRFHKLDKSHKLLSGTFSFVSETLELPSQFSTLIPISGSFDDIEYVEITSE